MTSLASTEAIDAPTQLAPVRAAFAHSDTEFAPSALLSSLPPPPSVHRTTVLPRIEGEGGDVRLVAQTKSRYEPIQKLGEGGMGEVVLVHDQDIARKVAVKRLLPEATNPVLLARFVDEIRTVGRLEHPNIVPIHDVGIDEAGRYFFVMKYVEGETLETIIGKLAAGDPEYRRAYTFERRVEIVIDVLQALSYAHQNGVVHRDIKPANVMVGRYGEVMLMDWGIAKPITEPRDLARGPDATLGDETHRGKRYMTHVGSLVGTPAYMSPEQARGDVDRLDAQSDLYSVSVMLHEFVTLRHYLDHEATTEGLLQAVLVEEPELSRLLAPHPAQRAHPRELVHIAHHGLAKDPAKRHASAARMIELLQDSLSGRIHVQCSTTMTKRMLREAARAVDKRPRLMLWALVGVVGAVLFTIVELVRLVVS
jgi:eukaryotic-like serine/threonine-protein kinase